MLTRSYNTGAFRRTWKEPLRKLLLEVVDAHQTLDGPYLEPQFLKRIKANPEAFLDGLVEYWWGNNYNAYKRILETGQEPIDADGTVKAPGPGEAAPRPTRIASPSPIDGRVDSANQIVAKIKLSLMVMPNGKTLKNCTLGEVRHMGASLGVFADKLSALGHPDKKVSEVANESKLKSLYNEHA
jgi:hypothetical protein